MLPGWVGVGAVHAFTAPHASVGACSSTAGAVGVGTADRVGADTGAAGLPQAIQSRATSTAGRMDWTLPDMGVASSYYFNVGEWDDPDSSVGAPRSAEAAAARLP